MRPWLWDSALGDRLWAGILPYRSATMVRSYRGLMAGLSGDTGSYRPWEEAPAAARGSLPRSPPPLSPLARRGLP